MCWLQNVCNWFGLSLQHLCWHMCIIWHYEALRRTKAEVLTTEATWIETASSTQVCFHSVLLPHVFPSSMPVHDVTLTFSMLLGGIEMLLMPFLYLEVENLRKEKALPQHTHNKMKESYFHVTYKTIPRNINWNRCTWEWCECSGETHIY